jgi:hypothetical protein
MNKNLTPPTNLNLIGLSGRIGSGKDTTTKIIQFLTCGDKEIFNAFIENPVKAMEVYDGVVQYNTDYTNKKFAYQVKRIVSELLGVTVRDLEDKTYIDEELPSNWWYYIIDGEKISYNGCGYSEEERINVSEYLVKLTPRKMMQLVGTDAGRDIIHPDIWVNATFSLYTEKLRWLVSDVRFPNELYRIHQEGGISIRTVRYKKLSDWLTTYYLPLTLIGDNEDIMMSDSKFCEFINNMDGVPSEVDEKLNHASEVALDGNHQFHYVIKNDGTIEDLVNKIYTILVENNIISEYKGLSKVAAV